MRRSLLVVASALLLFPWAFLSWVWLGRSDGDPLAAMELTLRRADDDPLLLLSLLDLVMILLTASVLVWQDARRAGWGVGARLAWAIAVLVFGTPAVWLYLVRRTS